MTQPLEDQLKQAYYYTEAGEWRGPEVDEWDRWHAVAKVVATYYAAPQQQVEPVAYIDPRQLARGYASLHCITRPEYRSYADAQAGLDYTPVYLHPPQRKPLTKVQLWSLPEMRGWFPQYHYRLEAVARAVERAIGEQE